jgi:hypothetical protein
MAYDLITPPTPSMKSKRCEPCKKGKHEDCEITIPRGFDEVHDRECLCSCHDPKANYRARGLHKANK